MVLGRTHKRAPGLTGSTGSTCGFCQGSMRLNWYKCDVNRDGIHWKILSCRAVEGSSWVIYMISLIIAKIKIVFLLLRSGHCLTLASFFQEGANRKLSPARVHRVQNEVFRVEAKSKVIYGNCFKCASDAGKWA